MNEELKNDIFTIPNALSIFRIFLIPIIVWLYVGQQSYFWTAATLVLSGVTDVVDGFLARNYNMISNVGKVLDPIADKLTQATVLFVLVTRFPFMLAAFIVLILKELFAAITGWLAIRKTNEVFSAKWHGKVSTALLYTMMFIHIVWYDIPPVLSHILIGICILMMVLSLVLYGIQNFKAVLGKK